MFFWLQRTKLILYFVEGHKITQPLVLSFFLHIISFNIPFPSDYGGVIDVFHKIRTLDKLDVKVICHCFQYGRARSKELENICEKVYYYPRKTGFSYQLNFRPYIIQTRNSRELLHNISKDPYPVLFEGLHTTYFLSNKELAGKIKIVRAHNIEHKYYFKLSTSEKKFSKKLFFIFETLKLYFAEKKLRHADVVAAISPPENEYYKRNYRNSILLNPFHSNDAVRSIPGFGKYILYHGNLSVPENAKAVDYLLNKIVPGIDYPLVIAGKKPDPKLVRKIERSKKVTLVASPSDREMQSLIQKSHINIVFSFQDTGIKLKLIESLFNGRHCICNKTVIKGTGLEDLCHLANSPMEFIIQIKKLLDTEFSESMISIRKTYLQTYMNEFNAQQIIDIIEKEKKNRINQTIQA